MITMITFCVKSSQLFQYKACQSESTEGNANSNLLPLWPSSKTFLTLLSSLLTYLRFSFASNPFQSRSKSAPYNPLNSPV